jgi:hypothetical protein
MRGSIMPQVAVIRNFPLFWGASGTAYQDEVPVLLTKSNGQNASGGTSRVSDHMRGQTSCNSTVRIVMVIAVAWAVAGLLIGLRRVSAYIAVVLTAAVMTNPLYVAA